MAKLTVKLAQSGHVTIPKPLLEQHHWEPGQLFTLLDIDGVIVMSPREAQTDALANPLRDELLAEGASLEEMLAELRRSRETDSN